MSVWGGGGGGGIEVFVCVFWVRRLNCLHVCWGGDRNICMCVGVGRLKFLYECGFFFFFFFLGGGRGD